MGWFTRVGAIAELVLEILKYFKKKEAEHLAGELKNAKTAEEKQAIAAKISSSLYSNF